MSNVLPPEELQLVQRRFRVRVVVAGSLTLILGAFVASLSLLPTFISVRIAHNSLANERDSLSSAATDDQSTQARALALLTALQGAFATSSPTGLLVHAIGLKPQGVTISSISYSQGQFLLGGNTARREAMSEYRTALERSHAFQSVAVPVSALVGTQGGHFTITLTGPF